MIINYKDQFPFLAISLSHISYVYLFEHLREVTIYVVDYTLTEYVSCGFIIYGLYYVEIGSLFETPWTVALQASLSMEFSRQEYWSGLPFPSPEELPHPRIKP